MNEAVPMEWIKGYVDQLLAAAPKFPEGKMRDACLLRADHALDLVTAWKEHKVQGLEAQIPQGAEG